VTPRPSSPEARRRFRAQRRVGTRPEIALRRALHARGHRYRIHRRVLPGVRREMDIVFPSARVVVLTDGCYWHGCPLHGTWPKANAAWWRAKIERNRERDRDTNRLLRAAGWRVVRVWEHEPIDDAVRRVETTLLLARSRRGRLDD